MVPHRSRARCLDSIRWPVVVVDFEASSLAPDSYPIEAGAARWREPDAPIETWSALIRPPREWRSRHWSTISETVHGISRDRLDREGRPAAEVMARMNEVVGRHAFCDGGVDDLRWLGGLEHASGIDATFLLHDADALGAALHPRFWRRMVRWLDRAPPRHRAADDAERHVRALAVGLSFRYGKSVVLP